MSTIARATIKSYDATTHSATVQIAGSLAVWLDSIPVSDGIAPADVVAGRECGVIFFTEDNPADAAIVTIHNAVPTGWPLNTSHKIVDSDASTYVDVEQSADEDTVRIAVGGTLRYLLQTASPHHQLTGDLSMIAGTAYLGFTGLGAPAAPDAQAALLIGNSGDDYNNKIGVGIYMGQTFALPANNMVGLAGKLIAINDTPTIITSLDFGVGGTAFNSGTKTINGVNVVATIQGNGTATVNYNAFTASAPAPNSAFTAVNYVGFTFPGRSSANLTKWTGLLIGNTALWNAATTVIPIQSGGPARTTNNDGSVHRMNMQFGSVTRAFGTGDGVIGLANATTNPSTNPAGGVVIYVSAATGDFYVRGAAGQICKLPTGGALNLVGAKAGNVALANLCTALALLGLIVDNTT